MSLTKLITNQLNGLTNSVTRGEYVTEVMTGDITDTRKLNTDPVTIPGYDAAVFKVAYGEKLYLVNSNEDPIMYCGDATTDNKTKIKRYGTDRFIAVNFPEDALIYNGYMRIIPNTDTCRTTDSSNQFNTDLWYVIDRETPIGMDFTTPPTSITTVSNEQLAFIESPTKTCGWKAPSTNDAHHSPRFITFNDTQLPAPTEDELTSPDPVGERINDKHSEAGFPEQTPTTDLREKHTDNTFECFVEDVLRAEPHLQSFDDALAYLRGNLTANPTHEDLRTQYHHTGLDTPTAQRIIDEHGYSRHTLSPTDKLTVLKHAANAETQPGTQENDVDARIDHRADELLSHAD